MLNITAAVYLLCYSCLRQSAGFRVAVYRVSQLTVNNEINKVMIPAAANIHQLMLILYAKL
jgi:hypothetical protein